MSEKMKAKCIVHEYYDRILEKYVKRDEVIEGNKERISYLVYKGLVEPVTELKKELGKAAANKD